MAARKNENIEAKTAPIDDALIVLVQEQDLVLEVTVQQGQTEAIDGPTLQVDWTQLHCVMDVVINTLVHTGTLPAEIVQTRERLVRGQKKGMDLVLELRLSERVEAEALKKISAVAEHTLATMMRKPSERSANQLSLICDPIFGDMANESIERDLDRIGGRNLKSKVHVHIEGQSAAILQGALGRRRDLSNFEADYKHLNGTIRGLINEPAYRCILFRPTEGPVVEVNFDENQIGTMLNLEHVLRLNMTQAACTIKTAVTKGSRGQAVYVFVELADLLPPETLLPGE